MLCSIGVVQKSYEIPNAGQLNSQPTGSLQGFSDVLQAVTRTNAVINEIESLGVNVTVRAVPNTPEMLRGHANTVSNFGSVTIAPNVLEEMANDLDVRRKYVGKIGDWLSSKPNHIAQ